MSSVLGSNVTLQVSLYSRSNVTVRIRKLNTTAALNAVQSAVKGLLKTATRIVIPVSLEEEMLDKLHTGRQGVGRRRARVQESD